LALAGRGWGRAARQHPQDRAGHPEPLVGHLQHRDLHHHRPRTRHDARRELLRSLPVFDASDDKDAAGDESEDWGEDGN
jgi:hypothetical protein